MKTNENQQTVLDFIEKFQNVSAEVIANGTGIFKLQVHKILKTLLENELISVDKEGTPPIYSCRAKTNTTKESTTKTKKEVQEDNGSEMEDIPALNSKGRDTSKLKFQGQEYGKGQLVLAVVKAHVEKNPRISFQKLKALFPDELQPRYGLIQEASKAKKLSSDRDRFFLKPEQLIKVEGKKVAVCSQWGANNIKPFLKIAKSLSYMVK